MRVSSVSQLQSSFVGQKELWNLHLHAVSTVPAPPPGNFSQLRFAASAPATPRLFDQLINFDNLCS